VVLHRYYLYVIGFTELLNPEFEDSESLDMPCTLDNNDLCTITSCTQGFYYKIVIVVWSGGRKEEWYLEFLKGLDDKIIIRNGKRGVNDFTMFTVISVKEI